MTLDEHYICQRAANAIISEIGPYRVSTDALQAINQFLDEFIVLLLTSSLSLDLSQIKSVVFNLLPSTLGKNAIVEAELEVKTFTETESIDYELYERMRNFSGSEFPLSEALPLLREKCFEYCTLADKEDQLYLQNSIRQKRNELDMNVIISPIVAIYVTTVMEHIAEYLLTAVAMSAEHEDTDYVRVKEVFLALVDDVQLGNVFGRMDLKDKMGKRAGFLNKLPQQNRKSVPVDQQNPETGSFLDITFDDLDLDYLEQNPRKSTMSVQSRVPEQSRPQSIISNYTNNNRKSTFHLFKNNRNSFSTDVLPRASSPDPSTVYDPDTPMNLNFEDLIKSGGTVKVSLTPNRLRSIEPTSPLSRQNSSSVQKKHEEMEVPKVNTRPQTPSSLGRSTFTVNEANRFESPREAPKPPMAADPTVPATIPLAAPMTRHDSIKAKVTAPLPKLPSTPEAMDTKPSSISSVQSNGSIVSDTSSAPSSTTLATTASVKSTISSLEQPPLPKPSKNATPINTNGMVIRRSSVSSRKSRENLRKLKEEGEKQQALIDEPLPTPPTDIPLSPVPPSKKEREEVVEEEKQVLSEEPQPIPEDAKESKTQGPPDTVMSRIKESDTLERPSSMVAKRASMVGNSRRRSLHESYAAEKHQDILVRQRMPAVGSVSVSVKQWDDILKPGEQQPDLMPPGSHRRSVLRQLRQQQLKEQQEMLEQQGQLPPPPLNSLYHNPNASNSNTILDKVLKFERASSLDDVAHQRVSHMPRRERFLYLQQDPSAIERKSGVFTSSGPKARNSVLLSRPKGVDQGIQTDPIDDKAKQKRKQKEDNDDEDEHGLIDGDEEWFLQDDEWDEQEETAIVEWLLGE
ncbi:uncharacterized protein B0P05DRAFT_552922 [Gilbertella persicaria]|uniref:uncharacterized protein n=1 Tax=Gilbertella persicaria TaxID=101096 RepID=UPI002220606C|nr:uncharacterized protein B0P05DRAFT_552922 [Gilbertella persicaria]KAI8066959.1 hypothetical protein B0P05DRAFT_552922 [Gilbertella persicaria]